MTATDLDAAFAAATPSTDEPPRDSDGPSGLLPAGSYEGTISSAEVRKGFRPWVEQELSLRIQVDGGTFDGKTTFCDVEIAPLTGRDGGISEGKMRYVKWQITDVLGYDGKLSELGTYAGNFVGIKVAFEQKVTPSMKVNPNTGKPYENREVTLKAHLGQDAVPSPVLPGESDPFTATATPDDDDIPF